MPAAVTTAAVGGRGDVRRCAWRGLALRRTPTWAGALVLCGAVSYLAALGGTASAAVALQQAVVPSSTVWLCEPGQPIDPCTSSLASTTVAADGSTTVTDFEPTSSSTFDCFYVYPTVSTQRKANANLKIQPAEIAAAISQASRFSQVCRVWAPMYRQRTAASLQQGLGNDPGADQVAYDSLLSDWEDYLAHDNDGRPVIFIGHSQGAAMLIRLLRSQIDPHPALREQMVSALILGGNVQVPKGKTVGGSFKHIPTCDSPRATRCVIAYSTFGTVPPPSSDFGRPGKGISLQSGQTSSKGEQVACVNPVTFSNLKGALQPYFPTVGTSVPDVTVSTPWVTFPGLYTAQCQSKGGATWLQVDSTTTSRDQRPRVTASLGPDWGYHAEDVNLALGDLVRDVAQEEAAYYRLIASCA